MFPEVKRAVRFPVPVLLLGVTNISSRGSVGVL